MKNNQYDLLIVGAGVSGSALLYLCTKYTNIKHIGIIEKYAAPARVNSLSSNNSQTLHCGDIETNYTLDKALKVQRAATMLRNYAVAQADAHHIIFKYPKMVLAVGAEECALLKKRFDIFSPFYPDLKLLDKKAIAKIEPNVAMNGDTFREDEIIALGSTKEYTAVNFEALSRSFVRQAQIEAEAKIASVLRGLLTETARTRLNNVKLVNRELYLKAVQAILYLANAGQLQGKLGEEELRSLQPHHQHQCSSGSLGEASGSGHRPARRRSGRAPAARYRTPLPA